MNLLRHQQRIPTKPVDYPSGVFIQTEKGYFFILNSTKRYYIITKRVLDSWNPQRVIRTSEAAVVNYKIAARLKFRNGSLIHNLSDGKIYLISDGERRLITNPDVFITLNVKGGKNSKEIVTVSQREIELQPEGVTLN